MLDYLERAELVYGDRGRRGRRARPAGGVVGRGHLRADGRAGPRPGRGARRARRRARASGSRSSRQNAARLLTSFFGVSGYGRVLVPINFRLNAAEVGYIVEHSGASVLLVDPELADTLADVPAKHTFVIGDETDARAPPVRRGAGAVGARRGRDRHHQLHERHDGASEGRAAHAPQPLDQRGDVRLADGRQRSRRVPAHAADVPLQRLGHDVRGHRHGRASHRAAQGRRRGDPAARRRARRHADVRRARGRRRGARRRGGVGRADPGRGPRARSWSRARRRRRARSNGSRPSSAGSSSRSTGSPRRRRCSR